MFFLRKKWLIYKNFCEELNPVDISIWLTFAWGSFFFLNSYSESAISFCSLSFIGIVFFNLTKNSKIYTSLLSISYLFYFVEDFPAADNHRYLFFYWLLTITFYNFHRNEKVLKKTAAGFIGIVFFFATFWKIYGGEYLDGSFFNVMFFYDQRFHPFTKTILGYGKYLTNYNFFISLNFIKSSPDQIEAYANPLNISKANIIWSYIWAYGTIFLEGLISVLFLRSFVKYSKLSDYVLIGFLTTVYWLLTVTGFGSILAIMGLTQSSRSTRPYYLLSIIILTFIKWL